MTNDEDTEEVAAEIAEESVKMGERGAEVPPEGQKCSRCDRDAVTGPRDKWLCQKHQKEYFGGRHG